MNRKQFFRTVTSLFSGLLVSFLLISSISLPAQKASAATLLSSSPSVTAITPTSAANDLRPLVTITGQSFTPSPTIRLGNTLLTDVRWISASELTARVPWGLPPGVYPLTVTNQDGGSDDLPNAFTVTQGFNVWTTNGPYGGNFDRVVMDPTTPATLFAAAPGVGIFRSRDGGAHWQQVMERDDEVMISFSISADTIYVGGQDGLAISKDGGDSWVHLPYFTKAFTHPVLNDVVFAITQEWADAKLVKSEDGGQTWIDWTVGITVPIKSWNSGGVVAFDPENPLQMVLATEDGFIFRSINGGANWNLASRPFNALWDMAVSPFGAHEVWVGPDKRWGDTTSKMMKSANVELTAWTSTSQASERFIRFPPAAWGEAYADVIYLPFGGIVKSTDGGATWDRKDYDFFASDLTFDPEVPNRMYTGGSGGIQLSVDGGQTWSPKNEGLTAVYPKKLIVAQQRPEIVYAISQSASLYGSEQAGASWKPIKVGDGSSWIDTTVSTFAIDPSSGARLYAGVREKIYVSNDGGQSWPIAAVLPLPTQFSNCSIEQQVLRTDPVIPGRLLAGVGYFCGDWSSMAGGLYLSTNSGQSWSYLASLGDIKQVNDILYDPRNPAKLYMAAGGGGNTGNGLFISTNSGTTWQLLSDPTPDNYMYSLAAEQTAPYRIYAASQYSDRVVFRSDDGGATWMKVTSPPSNISEQGLVVMPGNPQILYAATWGPGADAGLYRSDDGSLTWQRVDGRLGWVPIFSLAGATEGQRAILYVGTSGGMATPAGMTLNRTASQDTLVNAGVYRFSQLLEWYIYLPFVQH